MRKPKFLSYDEYCSYLRQRGYRLKDTLVFLDTPYGLWIQKIVQSVNGSYGLDDLLNPASNKDPEFRLTETGKKNASIYIRELEAKRKEILDVGLDTAEDTNIPTLEDIEADVNAFGIDEEGDYYNGWGVTDNYDADYPLGLTIGEDFEVVA